MSALNRDRLPVHTVRTGGGVHVDCRCGVVVRFMLHHDAKTSPAVDLPPGGGATALVPNAFPLPAGPIESGGSCPGFTDSCHSCYALNLEARYKNFGAGASANFAGLHHLYRCGGRRAVVGALVEMVNESAQRQRALGVGRPVFRWHSDGDIFARWYGNAIRETVEKTSGVDHWIYSRSLGHVTALLPAPENLRVYVSADAFNWREAGRVAVKHGLPVALLADDRGQAVALWARLSSLGPVPVPLECPVERWRHDGLNVPNYVTGPDGRRASARRGGSGVGACVACQACLPGGDRSVTFILHGGKISPKVGSRLGSAVRRRVPLGVKL